MDIIELKNHIIKKELSNFYIFTGEEIGIQKIYLEQMSKVYGMPITRAESVESIYSSCTTKSLLLDETHFYVIRGDKEFPKQESVYEHISESIQDNVIVLLYEKLDSRLKFGKFFKDCTIQFDKLASNVLISYIKKAAELSNKNAEELSNKVSGCYDLAMLEIDKIKNYAKVMQIDDNESFRQLSDSGVIYQPEETNVFKFADAVCGRRPKECMRIAQILSDNKVSSIEILGTLYHNMKNLLLVQCCDNSDICNTTGLDNRQVYFLKKYLRRYRTSELVDAVKLIEQVVSGIKSGWIDDAYAVRYVIVNIL